MNRIYTETVCDLDIEYTISGILIPAYKEHHGFRDSIGEHIPAEIDDIKVKIGEVDVTSQLTSEQLRRFEDILIDEGC